MVNEAHNARVQFRCLSCGQVDVPTRVGPAPGWISIALWVLSAAMWTLSYWWPFFVVAFWVALLAALIFTLWYFAKREAACRHCGARRIEPHTPAAGEA